MKENVKTIYQHYLEHPVVCTDTRKIQGGELFFALKGPNFDANQLVMQALELGAAFAVADDPNLPANTRILQVDDSLDMLQQLGNYHRRHMKAKVIAITGSNGKTTTKELVASVLNQHYKIIYTQGNLNNHIGVPLSLLQMNDETEIAVIEMGANHMGEIRALCQIAEPDFGIITNIGKAHLEGFGSLTGVINAKSELFAFIDDHEGMLFVNRDNELLDRLSANVRRFTYGSGLINDLYGELINAEPFLHVAWEYGADQMITKSNLIGNYNTENLLAAIAVGCHFGVSADKINRGIEAYVPSNNRSQLINTSSNRIIMDAYNANPVSMQAAINTFEKLRGLKSLVIIGDMLELGDESDAEHAQILRLLADLEIPEVFMVGPHFANVYGGDDWLTFKSSDELCTYLKKNTKKGYDILIKGSRGIQLEKILPYL